MKGKAEKLATTITQKNREMNADTKWWKIKNIKKKHKNKIQNEWNETIKQWNALTIQLSDTFARSFAFAFHFIFIFFLSFLSPLCLFVTVCHFGLDDIVSFYVYLHFSFHWWIRLHVSRLHRSDQSSISVRLFAVVVVLFLLLLHFHCEKNADHLSVNKAPAATVAMFCNKLTIIKRWIVNGVGNEENTFLIQIYHRCCSWLFWH